MPHSPAFHFQHFKTAQAPVYDSVLAELAAGHKRGHWMWFIFPQLAGLGRSDMAHRYGLADLEAARAYLAEPLLGARLFECSALVAASPVSDIGALFDAPDDMKFHSCMTLFDCAGGPRHGIFAQCLQKYFAGAPDRATLALLSHNPRLSP